MLPTAQGRARRVLTQLRRDRDVAPTVGVEHGKVHRFDLCRHRAVAAERFDEVGLAQPYLATNGTTVVSSVHRTPQT